MLICSNCGTKVADDSVYCPNCGKKIRRTNKGISGEKETSSLYIVLLIIICVLTIGCAVLGFLVFRSFKKKNPETEKSAGTTKIEEQEKPEAHNIYEQYFRESIIPEMGIANTERLEGTLIWTDTEQEDWCGREGVIGADFADLNIDGQEELFVYFIVRDSDQTNNSNSYLLNVNVYEITASNEVKKSATIQLAAFDGSAGAVEKVGILQLNGKNYLYHHEYEIGIIATGWRGYYTLYSMENRDLQKAYVLGNSSLGSAEECFCVEKYSDNKQYETVCYANALAPEMFDYYRAEGIQFADNCIEYNGSNRYECDQACWKQLGVNLDVPKDSYSKEPDYWNSSIARGGCSLVIRTKDSDYTGDSIDVQSEMEVRAELLPVKERKSK